MLTITETQAPLDSTLTVDWHVPFRFEACEGVLGGSFWWCTGNCRTSLMEIKIDGDSRLLLGVTLISYQGAVTRNPPSEYLLAVQAPKILKVDTSVFQDRILDEPYDLKLYRKDNAYFVVLSDDVHPSVCYRVGRMGFFISKSKICGFGFFDLTDDELQMLDDVGLGLEKGI